MSNDSKIEQTKKMLHDIDVKCLRKDSLEEDRILLEELNRIIELTIKERVYFYGISESDFTKAITTDIESKKKEINEQIQEIYDSKKADPNSVYTQDEKMRLIEFRTQLLRLEEHSKKIGTIFSLDDLFKGNNEDYFHEYLDINKEQNESFEELTNKCFAIIKKTPGFASSSIDAQIDFVYDYFHDHKLHSETASFRPRLEKLHFYEEEVAKNKRAAYLFGLAEKHIQDIVDFMQLYNRTDAEKKDRDIKTKDSKIRSLTANPVLGIINKSEKMRIETEIEKINSEYEKNKSELEEIEKRLESVGLGEIVEAYKELKSRPNVFNKTAAIMVADYIRKNVHTARFDIQHEIDSHEKEAEIAEASRIQAEKAIDNYKERYFGIKASKYDHPLMKKTFEEIDKLDKLNDLKLDGVSPLICIYIIKILKNISEMNIEDIIKSTNFEKEKISIMSANCSEMIDDAVREIQDQISSDLIIEEAKPVIAEGIRR